ncbi:hypothetical protein [Natrinema saccharevitans]|nr:hypothetical protein [Natrinema saccharevitans]
MNLSFETETAGRTLTLNAARAEWTIVEKRVAGEYRPTWDDLRDA